MPEVTVLVPLQPPHGCELCLPIPRNYIDHAGLVKHLKREHGATLYFECRVCGLVLDKLKTLKAHQLKAINCRTCIESQPPPEPVPKDRKIIRIPTRPRKTYVRRTKRNDTTSADSDEDNTPTTPAPRATNRRVRTSRRRTSNSQEEPQLASTQPASTSHETARQCTSVPPSTLEPTTQTAVPQVSSTPQASISSQLDINSPPETQAPLQATSPIQPTPDLDNNIVPDNLEVASTSPASHQVQRDNDTTRLQPTDYANSPHSCGSYPSFLPTAHKPADDNPLVAAFSPAEVSTRLQRSHNTVPGPDGLRYHHWLRTDPKGIILCSAFNAALRLLHIPSNWRHSNTILIHKRGDQHQIDNWRPIALSNTFGKTFSACLASRFLSWCTTNNIFSGAQKGFLRHEGCLDHSFLLQTIIQDARRTRSNCHIAWLDLANAFGSVPHDTILACLHWCGLHPDSVNVIRELLRDNFTSIRAHDSLTESIPINSGVCQGCPLSPLLFNVVVETAIRSVTELHHGYKLHGEEINILAYADDLVLISSTPDGLQQQLDRLTDWAKWAGLNFKPGKCATLSVLGERHTTSDDTFTLDGQQLPNLQRDESYTYLGIPTGFSNKHTNDSVISNLIEDISKLDRAKLAPWQKFDALNTILLPKLTFHLLLGTNPKKRLHDLDRHIKKCAKRWLNLPQRASPELIHLPYDRGGTNITPCSSLADICQLTHAAHLFDSRDPTVTTIALGTLRNVVRHRIRRVPTDEDIRAFLDGSMEGDIGLPSKDITSSWARLRAATRRLRKTIDISWHYTGTSFVLTTGGNIIPRHACTKVLMAMVKSATLHQLLQKPDQGKSFHLIAGHPTSNHFLRDGLYTSFADWRFVHRARLSVVPLNGLRRFGNMSKKCRQCSHSNETLAHVLNHCGPNLRLATQRHNSVLNRLFHAINNQDLKIYCNQNIPGFDDRCHPDLVTICERTKTATIIDVAVPFENGQNAFNVARDMKISKYSALTQHLRQQGYDIYCDAFIMGSLGGFDPANISVIQRLGISRKYAKMMTKLMVSDCIRWSREIYCNHLRYGRRNH
ncbi:uncharacterized protein LOC111614711 [Centruroides sculpturatus]|uniref:uncharacterized protein LOC111614711 n=1 Tax=Centruroides sculpturatus TaxID=218467 RepID=UPI000C6D48F1|nr:uncharacterized protein LOC111614711 [Centruroides sculpturatus]